MLGVLTKGRLYYVTRLNNWGLGSVALLTKGRLYHVAPLSRNDILFYLHTSSLSGLKCSAFVALTDRQYR
jgi:hypothetical protein